MSTTLIRLPWLSPATVLEYQLVISSRRPSMSSASVASAEVVMPWGHHRSVASSASFQRKPHSTARARYRRAHRLPVEVGEHPGDAHPATERSSAASMSAAFSSVRRRWMLAAGSALTVQPRRQH